MLVTRRQFGIAMLVGLGSLFFIRIVRALGLHRSAGSKPTRAMFWRKGDGLAG